MKEEPPRTKLCGMGRGVPNLILNREVRTQSDTQSFQLELKMNSRPTGKVVMI